MPVFPAGQTSELAPSVPAVALRGVTVEYPGVRALDDVSLSILAGEVHALMGENGAGKSTLIQTLAGVVTPRSGSCELAGEPLPWGEPQQAQHRGILTVYQEAELFDSLTVAENIAFRQGFPVKLGRYVAWRQVQAQAASTLALLPEKISPRWTAGRLSVAQRQLLQIATALAQQPRLLILDEPTSALSQRETEWLFEHIASLRERGGAVLYVSHRQEEVYRLADRITVLRDGRWIWTRSRAEASPDELIKAMVGRTIVDAKPRGIRPMESVVPPEFGPVSGSSAGSASGSANGSHNGVATAASVAAGQAAERSGMAKGAEAWGPAPHPPWALEVVQIVERGERLRSVSLQVAQGEIVGLYGLVGSGRSRLAQTLVGGHALARGEIRLGGTPVQFRSPVDAAAAGMGYLPEDRLRDGVCRQRSVRENLVLATLSRYLSWGWTSQQREIAVTRQAIQQLDVRCRSTEQPMGELSGGNQQKIVLGRWLVSDPQVLVLDEPTRGVDVAAKGELHRSIQDQVDQHRWGVLLISSDLTEILQTCQRIYVMREGAIVAEFTAGACSAEQIAAAALPLASGVTAGHARSALGEKGTDGRLAKGRGGRLPAETGLVAVTVCLLGALWLQGWYRGTGFDLANLFTHGAIWVVLGLAAAQVIIARGIDISLGSLVGLAAASAGLVTKGLADAGWAVGVALLAGLVTALSVGGVGGLINGALAHWGRVHPLVVTLGTMTVYRGLVIALLGGRPLTDLPPELSRWGVDPRTGFRGTIAIAALAIGFAVVQLGYTLTGRRSYAYGANPVAARLAGISVGRVWRWAFTWGGFWVGLAGWMSLTLNGQMQAGLGRGWELGAIAIAVIGGVTMEGGRGRVVGVVCAAILLRLFNTILVRWGVAEDQVDLLIGVFMLAAVLTDLAWRRVREVEVSR